MSQLDFVFGLFLLILNVDETAGQWQEISK